MEKLYIDNWFKKPAKKHCRKYTVASVNKLQKGAKHGKSRKKTKK